MISAVEIPTSGSIFRTWACNIFCIHASGSCIHVTCGMVIIRFPTGRTGASRSLLLVLLIVVASGEGGEEGVEGE